jgi:hypothetical protein
MCGVTESPKLNARNILLETSACSRAPTARKCNAEEVIEERCTKKVKKVSQKIIANTNSNDEYPLQTFTTAQYC